MSPFLVGWRKASDHSPAFIVTEARRLAQWDATEQGKTLRMCIQDIFLPTGLPMNLCSTPRVNHWFVTAGPRCTRPGSREPASP